MAVELAGERMFDHPRIFFLVSFFVLWISAQAGAYWRRRRFLTEEQLADFGVIEAATLTLLGLIIGFSFSMATGRYDLRKSYEEAEANAIGTEYVRADLLPADEALRVKTLLREYTDLRVRFYSAPPGDVVNQIRADVGKMQDQLWTAATASANATPTPLRALVVAGMNDVLNSEGYTQAAWWNRIPVGAWCLMFAIAVFCNVLLGYGAHKVDVR